MVSCTCAGLSFGMSREARLSLNRNSKVRQKRLAIGRGSAPLNRVLTDKKLRRNTWSERDLLKTAPAMGAGTGPTRTLSWGKATKKARTLEAGK